MVELGFAPLTPERFGDLERLFEADGLTRGCWCMWWRLDVPEWRAADPGARRAAFRARVAAGPPPGLLAYRGGAAVGWVQATPRADVPRFNRARTAKPAPGTDLGAVWALSCFFLAREVRRQGLMTALARAACDFAAGRGAAAVEAAAIELERKPAWGEGYVGFVPALERAGFRAVERRSPTRVLMRWEPRLAS
jgi:GNAT superfamily N-acetyltransferase